MKNTFRELITYLKNPVLEKDKNSNLSYRFTKFIHLLIICILTSGILMPLFYLIEYLGLIDMEKHAMEEMMKTLSKPMIFFFAVVLAPLIEELIFRGQLPYSKIKHHIKLPFTLLLLYLD
ncbi:hypothetical protein [Tenacibaculum sp. nBUS_03]|uniref:hypothetical protein n=1 Tax=Tenacibaculum sp. nBUS_03 TaxID=3395320 RepID=UPI003EBBA650